MCESGIDRTATIEITEEMMDAARLALAAAAPDMSDCHPEWLIDVGIRAIYRAMSYSGGSGAPA